MDWNAVGERLRRRQPELRGQRPPAAVLALVAGESLVLEVRSSALRTQPGEICFPGGSMEPGEDPVKCALRETEEELGLSSSRIQVLGELDSLIHGTGRLIYPVLARTDCPVPEGLHWNPDEVEQVFTVPLAWFCAHPPKTYQYRLEPRPDPSMPEQMQRWLAAYPNCRRGIYWQAGQRLIWGLTARVIGQLLDLLAYSEGF